MEFVPPADAAPNGAPYILAEFGYYNDVAPDGAEPWQPHDDRACDERVWNESLPQRTRAGSSTAPFIYRQALI